ncbi:hypothetical protein BGZ95_008235, partial [Linnemannia exigua]
MPLSMEQYFVSSPSFVTSPSVDESTSFSSSSFVKSPSVDESTSFLSSSFVQSPSSDASTSSLSTSFVQSPSRDASSSFSSVPLPSVEAATLFSSSVMSTSFNPSTLQLPPSSSDTSDFPVLPEESEDEQVMYVAGHVKNHKFDVLIDCGASANFINQEIVRALNIPTSKKKDPLSVNGFGGSSTANCTRYCHIRLKLADNFQPVIQFLVIPMRFDLVIGKRWLARSSPKPDVDLAHHTIRVGSDILIQGYVQPSHTPVLSAMQFKRCL